MDDGRGCANQEKENETVTLVDVTMRVQALWSDDTPL